MWREAKKNSRVKVDQISNNRLYLVVAVIFLLFIALIYQLFKVQISEGDMYTARAASQQQVYNQLKPARGEIFFGEKPGDGSKLYLLATNKNFAIVNVVPKDIKDPVALAEKMYQFFDQAEVAKKVNLEMKKTAPANLTAEEQTALETAKLDQAKAVIIEKYLKKFDKPNDPWEPLRSKVDEDELLKLYAFLASSETKQVDWHNLELRRGEIVYKDKGDLALKIPGLAFRLEKYRYYPENEIGSSLLGFVSNVNGKEAGHYGLEEFFNSELFGKYGSVKSEKGGRKNIMIVNDRKYLKPQAGSDLVLTLDRNIQFKACEELKKTVKKYKAEGGTVIIMNPQTGAIIAMCSLPDFNPNDYRDVKDIKVYNNPAIFYQYEPGSVFKAVTMSIAIDQGKVSPSTIYDDKGEVMIEGWDKPIRNADFYSHGPHGIVDMSAVLEYSLNTGAIFAMEQVGPKVFADYVKRFGFGEKTGIELGSESPGDINNLLVKRVKKIDAATASFGQGIAVTPLQMIMPYQVIANKGVLMKPYIVKSIITGQRVENTVPKRVAQVISEKTANTVLAMLVNVVEKGHDKRAAVAGYYVGGKTGTAQVAIPGGYSEDKYIHTFVGIAPINKPVFVMLIKINDPQGARYSVETAVPMWHNIADFILKYYHVPKTRK